MAATVLVIDDDDMLRSFFGAMLHEEGYEVLLAATGAEGEALLEAKPVDVVLLDLKLPDADGLTILRKIRQEDPNIRVIVLTAFGAVHSAVEAMKLGAYDYIDKPSDISKLKLVVQRALREIALKRELDHLRRKPGGYAHGWIVGKTKRMCRIAELVERVAQGDVTVLLQGESGTGKEVVARTIHLLSPRADSPFTAINCAAIPEDLLESELFGFEAGAFTGARSRKKGLLEVADGGTLFFDEIGEMKPRTQAKILRTLETKTLRRVGGTADVKVNVRFIAASNQDLWRAVQEGTFREDLYYRLNVVAINLPPLRERMRDLELFIAAFVDEFNRTMGKSIVGVSADALQLMRRYPWPGNIRELRNVIERAMVLCDGREIQGVHLPAELSDGSVSPGASGPEGLRFDLPSDGVDLEGMVSRIERHLIREALSRTSGNQSEAAALLSISRDQLRYRLQKYGLS
ncbi:MAG TPA: sigma-54-dependent Fis family transcriptional regulator [Chloroflexi bacterium]|nr:sigma-54-dependent Fis family transcriptional regulator [Chloroflexota bacterium]